MLISKRMMEPKFYIEAFLNSLPDNIKVINVSNKNLDYIPSLSRFRQLRILNCTCNNLTSLPELNENLVILYCYNNRLSCLPPLNKKLKILRCFNNLLTSLPPLNDNLTELFCNHNELAYLPQLNKKLNILFCQNNQLTYLPPLNENLNILFCQSNQLTYLPPLNENLTRLNCQNNQLTRLPPLNENLERLNCQNNNLTFLPPLNDVLHIFVYNDNPIHEILYDASDITSNIILKIKIQKLNRFREFYYSLKFKQKFRNWIWVKIREPKIILQYHPYNLIKLNDETTDLIDFLDNWQ